MSRSATHATHRQRKLELLIALSAAVAAGASLAPTTAAAATVECTTWVSTIAYVAGDTAIRNGVSYKANWWTQGNDPATNNGGAGIHFWSLDRDNDCAPGYASATCNSYGSAGTWGFTNAFISDLGL